MGHLGLRKNLVDRVGSFTYNVNPGLINPKQLFNWEGTIKKYQIMAIGGIPPYCN